MNTNIKSITQLKSKKFHDRLKVDFDFGLDYFLTPFILIKGHPKQNQKDLSDKGI